MLVQLFFNISLFNSLESHCGSWFITTETLPIHHNRYWFIAIAIAKFNKVHKIATIVQRLQVAVAQITKQSLTHLNPGGYWVVRWIQSSPTGSVIRWYKYTWGIIVQFGEGNILTNEHTIN